MSGRKLLSAIPKIVFFFFFLLYIIAEKGRSWHILNDLCFMQYSIRLKWFPFACSVQELACSLGTQNSTIMMQGLCAAVSEMLKAAAVTSTATANLWVAGKVIDANVPSLGYFILRLVVFEGVTTSRCAGEIAQDYPTG